MRVEQFLRSSARNFGDKVALVTGGARLTYGELDELSDRLAATLESGGVRRGDRVAVFMENCWEAVVGIFAALKAGAVFCPIHASTKAGKLAYVLNHCRATALITQERLVAVAEAAPARSLTLALVAGGSVGGLPNALTFDAALAGSGRPSRAGIDLDLAMLIYTSGSTGLPKGVMMTHRNMVAAATSITTYLENTADDVILDALPLSFDYGLYQVLMAAKLGATLVLEKSFAFPELILETMAAERVTGLPIVPAMAAILLQSRNVGALPHLRYITVPPRRCRKRISSACSGCFRWRSSIRCTGSPNASAAPICRPASLRAGQPRSASPFRTPKPTSWTNAASALRRGSSASSSCAART